MACSCKTGRRTALQFIDKSQINHKTYNFDFVPIEPMRWKEGDSSALVLQIKSLGMEDSRKLSYASMPWEKVVRFTTRITDNPSVLKESLHRLQVGDIVVITYPEGKFSLKREGRPILLLSNGVGIAAIRTLVKAFDENPFAIDHMTQINVDSSGAIYNEEFRDIASRNKGFNSIYVTHRSHFYDALDEAIRDLMFTSGRMPYFYIVGSDSFVSDVKVYLYPLGYDDRDLITDQQGCSCGSTKINKVKAKGTLNPNRAISLLALYQ